MTDLSPEELRRKRKIAEAATPGPWEFESYDDNACARVYGIVGRDFQEVARLDCNGLEPHSTRDEDAAHIATFDPPTVRALLEEIVRLREELSDYRVMAAAATLAVSDRTGLPQGPPEEK